MNENRFILDIRVGCGAVIDKSKFNFENNGLHKDMEGVMLFINGYWGKEERKWVLPLKAIEILNDYCIYLNEMGDK